MKQLLLLSAIVIFGFGEVLAYASPPAIQIAGPSSLQCPQVGNYTARITNVLLDESGGVSNFQLKWEFILGNETVTTVVAPEPGGNDGYVFKKSYTPPSHVTTGTYVLKVTASWDYSNDLSSGHEVITDTYNVQITQTFPDLVPIITSSPGSFTPPGTFYVDYRIKNQGNCHSGNSIRSVYIYEEGQGIGNPVSNSIGSLDPNEQSITYSVPVGSSGYSSGTNVKVLIRVDGNNQVTESDEGNNDVIATIHINSSSGRFGLSTVSNPISDEIIHRITDLSGRTIWKRASGDDNSQVMNSLERGLIYIFHVEENEKIRKVKRVIR